MISQTFDYKIETSLIMNKGCLTVLITVVHTSSYQVEGFPSIATMSAAYLLHDGFLHLYLTGI